MKKKIPEDRDSLSGWVAYAAERLREYERHKAGKPVTSPPPTAEALPELFSGFDFRTPLGLEQVVDVSMATMTRWGVRSTSSSYFGWLNATPTVPSVVADLLVSALNPQLAVWAKSPGPIEVERYLVDILGKSFGLPNSRGGGFTTGGSEANLTACLLALNQTFPGLAENGLPGSGRVVVYVSEEGHKSLEKVAASIGIGRKAICRIPIDPGLRIDLRGLRERIRSDRASGGRPLMVVGLAGSTNAGVIDPLDGLADLCASEDVWFHVDAAWGGAIVFSDRFKTHLAGIERADSITFDPHKWVSVPLGTCMILVHDRRLLKEAFQIVAPYVSPAADDPYLQSIQWSRRFIGLRLLMTLLSESWHGIADRVERQILLGDRLRELLTGQGWTIINQTPLPTVCFMDGRFPDPGQSASFHAALADAVNGRGRVRIAGTWVGGVTALRVCICSRETSPVDLAKLMDELEWAREKLGSSWPGVAPRRDERTVAPSGGAE